MRLDQAPKFSELVAFFGRCGLCVCKLCSITFILKGMTLGVLTTESEQQAALEAGQKSLEGTMFSGYAGFLFRIAMQRKDRE